MTIESGSDASSAAMRSKSASASVLCSRANSSGVFTVSGRMAGQPVRAAAKTAKAGTPFEAPTLAVFFA